MTGTLRCNATSVPSQCKVKSKAGEIKAGEMMGALDPAKSD
jgi:hypothetical protein